MREYGEMEHNYKLIQNDNYALREYVIQLQSRLLDLRQDLPPAPPNVNLSHQPDAAAVAAAAAAAASTSRSAHPQTVAPVPAPVTTAAPAAVLPPPPPPSASTAPQEPRTNANPAGTLADVAAAVADLRARDSAPDGVYPKTQFKTESSEDQQAGEEIRRQLQQDAAMPPPSSLRA